MRTESLSEKLGLKGLGGGLTSLMEGKDENTLSVTLQGFELQPAYDCPTSLRDAVQTVCNTINNSDTEVTNVAFAEHIREKAVLKVSAGIVKAPVRSFVGKPANKDYNVSLKMDTIPVDNGKPIDYAKVVAVMPQA
jgi:hypothetical protein